MSHIYSPYEDMYKFTFNETNDGVLQMFEVDHGRLKAERLSIADEFEVNLNVGGDAVEEVARTTTKSRSVESEFFTDTDGDGYFQKMLEVEVRTSDVRLEQHKFTFDGDTVTEHFEMKKRGRFVRDRIDDDESYERVTIGDREYVLGIERDDDEVEFELFRDDNADDIWSQIASGEVAEGLLIDGEVDLASVAAYLAAADAIVG